MSAEGAVADAGALVADRSRRRERVAGDVRDEIRADAGDDEALALTAAVSGREAAGVVVRDEVDVERRRDVPPRVQDALLQHDASLRALLRRTEDDVRRAVPPRLPRPPRPDTQLLELDGVRQSLEQLGPELRERGGIDRRGQRAGPDRLVREQRLERCERRLMARREQRGERRVAPEHGSDPLDERGLEAPEAGGPPPPRPPAAAPSELDPEGTVHVRRVAADEVVGAPEPPPVDVVRAHLRARNRIAVGAPQNALDRERAAPPEPPVPVVRRDPDRGKPEPAILGPPARRDVQRDRLEPEQLLVVCVGRPDHHANRARMLVEREGCDRFLL